MWEKQFVENLSDIITKFEMDKPVVGAFDTETTGLHIIKDKPFLYGFGWITSKTKRVYAFEPTKENMSVFMDLAKRLKYLVGFNIKYDLHMTDNIGYKYRTPNIVEGQALARLSVEAVPAREGGDSLKLESLADKYIEANSSRNGKVIRELLKEVTGMKRKELVDKLKEFPIIINGEVQKTATGKVKYWSITALQSFEKDIMSDLSMLPEAVQELWRNAGDIQANYEDVYNVYPDLMIEYVMKDVIMTLELAVKFMTVVKARNQENILKMENNLVYPLLRMERVGIKTDRAYLLKTKEKLKNYIISKRGELYEIAGEEVNCSQHKRIKEILKDKWGIETSNVDDSALKRVLKTSEGNLKKFIELIRHLRTCEKWYSTYVVRYERLTDYDGRFYTQVSQCSAVSGRVGSDSQQMPKKSLVSLEGEELFNVRKLFVPTDAGKDEGYTSIWYCDQSQVELRVAGHYTLLVSNGDENLCSAYMPFNLRHYKTGEVFDYKTKEGRMRWNERKDNGESAWEDAEGKSWIPTDVHAETASKAYPHLERGTPEFIAKRNKEGKVTNFLCLYGGTSEALQSSLDVSEEEAVQLHEGYKKAFPELQTYSEAVTSSWHRYGYVANMSGRRYYLKDFYSVYKLANYCIQGSCADELKKSIIKIDNMLLPYKSRMILNIHDEVQIEVWKGEEFIIPKVLEYLSDIDWSLVPIVCDAEVTYTNWSEAKEVEV